MDKCSLNMNSVTRTFHSVGQGAFYSERFNILGRQFNIVYDCGTQFCSKQKERVVKQSFDKEDVIDILFISHLDWDHISLIPTLYDNVKNIKHVVMPFVNCKTILLSLLFDTKASKKLLERVFDLILSPEEFFGEGTKIWQVKPTEKEQEVGNNELILLDDISRENRKIQSGTKLGLEEKEIWCFIPFNYSQSSKFNEEIAKVIENKSFSSEFNLLIDHEGELEVNSVMQALSDPGIIRKLIGEKRFKGLKNKLKEIYNRLEGKINANSLVLYSGPVGFNSNNSYCLSMIYSFQGRYFSKLCRVLYHECFYDYYFDIRERVACIYNGDSNYKEKILKRSLCPLWENVGTIQVAHHGSIKSHDSDLDNDGFYLCPISHGEKNIFGHPSSLVISDLLKYNRIPVNVTESTSTTYTQVIGLFCRVKV